MTAAAASREHSFASRRVHEPVPPDPAFENGRELRGARPTVFFFGEVKRTRQRERTNLRFGRGGCDETAPLARGERNDDEVATVSSLEVAAVASVEIIAV